MVTRSTVAITCGEVTIGEAAIALVRAPTGGCTAGSTDVGRGFVGGAVARGGRITAGSTVAITCGEMMIGAAKMALVRTPTGGCTEGSMDVGRGLVGGAVARRGRVTASSAVANTGGGEMIGASTTASEQELAGGDVATYSG